MALSMCTRLRTRSVGRNQSNLWCRFGLPWSEGLGLVSAYDGVDAKPNRHMRFWSKGRKVAIHPAVIPIPGSTVDHIDTSMITSEQR